MFEYKVKTFDQSSIQLFHYLQCSKWSREPLGFGCLLLVSMNAKKPPRQQNNQLSTQCGFLKVFGYYVGNFAVIVLSWMLWEGNGDHISTKYQPGVWEGQEEINFEIMMKIDFPFCSKLFQ